MTDKTKPTKFEQTHIAMVLDRSGSMETCRQPTIDSVNKYLLEARKDDILKEADFQLLTFDSQSIDTVRSGAPLNVPDIEPKDFVPRASTPLYDAVGRGIDSLEGKLAASGSTKAILVIVTDGAENASRKYNHASISEKIKAKQDAGWLVVFLGAGLQAAQQGLAMGVRAAYTGNIAMDETSLGNMSHSVFGLNASYSRAANTQDFVETSSGAFSVEDRKAMGDASGGAGLLGNAATLQPDQQKTNKLGNPIASDAVDTWVKPAGDAWGTYR